MESLSRPSPPRKQDIIQNLSDIHNYGCNINTGEIYLHEHFGSGDENEKGISFRESTAFIKNLNLLQNLHKNILIHLNLVGGKWDDGMAIYDSITTCKVPTAILAYSSPQSMSSIIFQAATYRVLMPNTEYMIHNGHVEGTMDYNTLLSEAAAESVRHKTMLNIYAKRCINGQYFTDAGLDLYEIECFLNNEINKRGDWYLFAEQAVQYGFTDAIFGTPGNSTIEEIRAKLNKT